MSREYCVYSTKSNIVIYKFVEEYVRPWTNSFAKYSYVIAFYSNDEFDNLFGMKILEFTNKTLQKKQLTQHDMMEIWRRLNNQCSLPADITTQSYLAKEHDKRKAAALKSTMVIVIYFRLTFDVVVARRLFYWCSLNFLSWHWLAQTGNDVK